MAEGNAGRAALCRLGASARMSGPGGGRAGAGAQSEPPVVARWAGIKAPLPPFTSETTGTFVGTRTVDEKCDDYGLSAVSSRRFGISSGTVHR